MNWCRQIIRKLSDQPISQKKTVVASGSIACQLSMFLYLSKALVFTEIWSHSHLAVWIFKGNDNNWSQQLWSELRTYRYGEGATSSSKISIIMFHCQSFTKSFGPKKVDTEKVFFSFLFFCPFFHSQMCSYNSHSTKNVFGKHRQILRNIRQTRK